MFGTPLIFSPAPGKDWTEKGKKQQEYSSNVKGGLGEGKEVNIAEYEKALADSNTTHEEARKYWNDVSHSDPYSNVGLQIDDAINIQAPKVEIKDNGISISAPQSVLDSPLVQQIDEQLQALKGSDLNSAEVKNAIDTLNEEIRKNLSNALVEETFGWTPEQYADYKYIIQTINVPNPMSSSNKIKGYDRYGGIQMKTPQEWIDYYREAYNVDERTDAFLASLDSDSPYGRTMALVMGGGTDTPIYGYDPYERIGQLFARGGNEFWKLPKGIDRNLMFGGDAKRVDTLATKLGIIMESIIPNELSTDENVERERYEKNKNDIAGKSWSELTDDQKGFLLKVAVSRESGDTRAVDRDMFNRGGGPGADIEKMSSEDNNESRETIQKILNDSGYERYKEVENNYMKLAYADMTDSQAEERLKKNAIWSGNEQQIGNAAGTILRFMTEDYALGMLTGFSMNSISDALGEKLVNAVTKLGFVPSTVAGKALLSFSMNLVGTIPEDIVQTAVDNILTDNAEENAKLLSTEEISDNFKNNLIFMSLFNGAKAGWSAVKYSRILKKLKKQADLGKVIDIGAVGSEPYDIAKTYEKGGHVETDGESVYKVNADGSKEKLEHTTPEQARILQNIAERTKASEKTAFDKILEDREAARVIADGGTLEVRDGKVYAVDVNGNTKELSLVTVGDADLIGKAVENRDAARILASGGTIEIRDGKVYGVDSDGNAKDSDGNAKELSGLTVEEAVAINKATTQGRAAEILLNSKSVEVRDGKVHVIGEDGSDVEIDGLTVEDAQVLNRVVSDKEALKALANGGNLTVEGGRVYVTAADGNKIEMNDFSVQDAQALTRVLRNREAADILANDGNVEIRGGRVYAVSPDGTAVELDGLTIGDAMALNRAMVDKEIAEMIANGGKVEVRDGRVYVIGSDGRAIEVEGLTVEDARKLNDIISEKEKATSSDVDSGKTKYEEAVEKVKQSSGSGESTVKVDVDSVDGRTEVEVKDYNFKSDSPEDVLSKNIKIEATKPGIIRWYNKALNALMRHAQTNLFNEFRARFGNEIDTNDFDTVLHYTKAGLTPDQIIGKKIVNTNRVVTQNTIDALKWWAEQAGNKVPRMRSLEVLGKKMEDFNRLGYLPHTSYDPWVLPFGEGKAGQLWQEYSGKSMTDAEGNFIGYGGTIEGRYRTFLSNMLLDIASKEIEAAKLVEEAALDGKKITAGEAMQMSEGWNKIEDSVTNPKKSKSMDKNLKGALADGDEGKAEFEAADKAFREEAPNSGISKSINKNFSEMYIGSGLKKVEQPERVGAFTYAVGQQSDTMRNIKVDGVSMYDAGGASIVYAFQDAGEFVERWILDGADPSKFRSNLVNFLEVRSGRSTKYAEPVADRIIARIVRENPGEITKGGVINTLGKAFKSEGFNRLRRWITLADYSQFHEDTAKFMDSFLYGHMQMDGLAKNQNIIAKAANMFTELRYDALFYWNFKNSLLQVSELNRLFTVFEWGDVATMLRKMATDADFRAKVDMYVDAVAPRTKAVDAGLYDKYGNVSESMEVKETETTFGKIKDAKSTIDDIALAPIEAAEALKNRTLVAALVAEADRLEKAGAINGGNEKLMWIRQRFERVALAQNEMGKIGLATNQFAKPFLFLQNFQIRELGMNYYNIVDPIDLKTGTKITTKSGKALNAVKYLTKLFGVKLGTTLILARLGYSAAQTMGLDPLGLVGNYDRLDEDEKTIIDRQISGGLLTPLFAGGMTSLFADMYFMARKAYEDAHRESISDDAEARLNNDWFGGVDLSALGGGNLLDLLTGFIPGSTAANRVGQMNEMLDTGWATSASGNKMYTAPDDPFNTALGYLFGRSATQNAQQYRQTYGNDLGQTLGRIWRGSTGQGSEFDPMDTQNYTDWFDGSENDAQQFEKGRRWFQSERDRIIDAYTEALRNSRGGDIYEEEAKNDMNQKLEELYNKLSRFVGAYEQVHGNVTGKMVKQILNLLDTEQEVMTTDSATANEEGLKQWDKALDRYAQYGLPNVGYYSGPETDYAGTSEDESKKELKYKGSPQWQVSSGAKYDLQTEAAAVLKAGDAVLEDLRKDLKDIYGNAVQTGDYTEFNNAQYEYLKAFDNVVGPIIAMYGNSVLNSKVVKSQLESMLATSTNTGKVNLIPSDQYAKDKWGRYRSMPNESVDVGKWAQERYSDDIFKRPTVKSYSTAQEDIDNIQRLVSNGQTDMARALALELKVRIDNQKRSLSKTDYQWLLDFLNNGGQQ